MKRIALTVVALVCAAPALSKPITVNGHYFEFAAHACSATNTCILDQFTPVPRDSGLVITQVSCTITADSATKLEQVFIDAKGGTGPVRIHHLVPTLLDNAAGGRQYSLNQQVLEPLQGKEIPFIEPTFDQSTNISMGCSIAGILIP